MRETWGASLEAPRACSTPDFGHTVPRMGETDRQRRAREASHRYFTEALARMFDPDRKNRTAGRIIDLWDARRARGAEPLFHPTIGGAIRAGRPWLTCYCPGCGVVGEIDLRRDRSSSRRVDRKPDPAAIVPAVLAASAVRAIDRTGRATGRARSVPLGEVMPLFWIVHEIDGERRIFIQEAGALIFARLKASIAGFDDGVFVEAHMLDAKTARKVPKKMIGRVLSPREVSALLDRCRDGGGAVAHSRPCSGRRCRHHDPQADPAPGARAASALALMWNGTVGAHACRDRGAREPEVIGQRLIASLCDRRASRCSVRSRGAARSGGSSPRANLRVVAQIDDALRHTGMRASELHGMRWRPTAGRLHRRVAAYGPDDQAAPVGAIEFDRRQDVSVYRDPVGTGVLPDRSLRGSGKDARLIQLLMLSAQKIRWEVPQTASRQPCASGARRGAEQRRRGEEHGRERGDLLIHGGWFLHWLRANRPCPTMRTRGQAVEPVCTTSIRAGSGNLHRALSGVSA